LQILVFSCLQFLSLRHKFLVRIMFWVVDYWVHSSYLGHAVFKVHSAIDERINSYHFFEDLIRGHLEA
jgi:hypothetical protein